MEGHFAVSPRVLPLVAAALRPGIFSSERAARVCTSAARSGQAAAQSAGELDGLTEVVLSPADADCCARLGLLGFDAPHTPSAVAVWDDNLRGSRGWGHRRVSDSKLVSCVLLWSSVAEPEPTAALEGKNTWHHTVSAMLVDPVQLGWPLEYSCRVHSRWRHHNIRLVVYDLMIYNPLTVGLPAPRAGHLADAAAYGGCGGVSAPQPDRDRGGAAHVRAARFSRGRARRFVRAAGWRRSTPAGAAGQQQWPPGEKDAKLARNGWADSNFL
jgi:hypothetical protein